MRSTWRGLRPLTQGEKWPSVVGWCSCLEGAVEHIAGVEPPIVSNTMTRTLLGSLPLLHSEDADGRGRYTTNAPRVFRAGRAQRRSTKENETKRGKRRCLHRAAPYPVPTSWRPPPSQARVTLITRPPGVFALSASPPPLPSAPQSRHCAPLLLEKERKVTGSLCREFQGLDNQSVSRLQSASLRPGSTAGDCAPRSKRSIPRAVRMVK